MEFVKPPENPFINVLIYGVPKTGKSAGAGTAPGGVLYLNFDLPNATRYVHRNNPDGRIMEPRIAPYEEGKTPIMDLLVEVHHTVYDPTQTIIDSVVVDPAGELYRRLLEEQANRAIRPSLNKYGDVTAHVERFCRAMCEAPVNTVIVAHDFAVKDEGSGEVRTVPFTGTAAGSEALGKKLEGMVDIVAYTGVVELEDGSKEYMAQLIPGKGRVGGDRFSCLGDTRKLNLTEWVETIKAHEAANPQPQAQAQANGKAKRDIVKETRDQAKKEAADGAK